MESPYDRHRCIQVQASVWHLQGERLALRAHVNASSALAHPLQGRVPRVSDTLWPQAHYSTLLRLKQYFPFSLIDAMGTMDDTKSQILSELRYQSSLDLDDATYQSIKHLPLARHLVKSSRAQLVTRLDNYCKRHNEVFQEVIRC